MADIKFVIESRTGMTAKGTLKWPAKSLSSPARSGPFVNGPLPLGHYHAKRSKLLDQPVGSSYCDRAQPPNCWMQVLEPQFSTTRISLGIHPDGGTPGTEGCIGIDENNSSAWYEAFREVSGFVTVEVVE